MNHDTIAAIASPLGEGCRGIIRVSGSQALSALVPLIHWEIPLNETQDVPRGTVLSGSFKISEFASLPCHIYVWPMGKSYTGELVCEIHTWQSPPLLDHLLQTICATGVRIAKPGEFTLRAFLHGRMDLARAEGVLGVIDAHSEREMRIALEQLGGGLSLTIRELRQDLLNLLADLEAGLDFVDEDITFVSQAQIQSRLLSAIHQAGHLAVGMDKRLLSGGPVRVTLWGRPNVGKSTLLNALVADAIALVSERAGTTRDVIRAHAIWDGVQIEFSDTAGMAPNPTGNSIMHLAESHGSESRARANLCILCVDSTHPVEVEESGWISKALDARDLVVATKGDQPPAWEVPASMILVSSHNAHGIDFLRRQIVDRLRAETSSDVVGVTAARCRTLAQEASRALQSAYMQSKSELGDELIAGEIWNALNALGQIIGDIYTDDLLDRIFSRFCIGK